MVVPSSNGELRIQFIPYIRKCVPSNWNLIFLIRVSLKYLFKKKSIVHINISSTVLLISNVYLDIMARRLGRTKFENETFQNRLRLVWVPTRTLGYILAHVQMLCYLLTYLLTNFPNRLLHIKICVYEIRIHSVFSFFVYMRYIIQTMHFRQVSFMQPVIISFYVILCSQFGAQQTGLSEQHMVRYCCFPICRWQP